MGKKSKRLSVAQLNSKANPKFQDFISLKVPKRRDKYSGMKFANLRELCSEFNLREFDRLAKDLEVKRQEVVLRWLLRGLRMDLAFRIEATKREVAKNAAQSRSNYNSVLATLDETSRDKVESYVNDDF